MIKLAIVADDLTGANDTGVQFAKCGIKSYVILDAANQDFLPAGADVVVLDTDSRAISPDISYSRVKKACQLLKNSGVSQVYKKIDSTLRGNIGREIQAAAEVFCPDIIVIAPAFPRTGRTTVGGYHLLNQLPVSLTEIARDPKAPVNESFLPELLRKQTETQVGHIPLKAVLEGAPSIRAAVSDNLKQGIKWLVFDAVTDDNLRQIAVAASEYDNILWVGSAGLAETLPELYGWPSCGAPPITFNEGAALIVAGSVSQITRNQMTAFLKQPSAHLVEANAAQILSNRSKEVERCILAAKNLLKSGKDVAVASAIDACNIDSAATEASRCGLSNIEASNQIAAALGDIAAQLATLDLAGMVLTGGDTAVSACRALGATSIEILEEVTAGIPIGKLHGGSFAGLTVVTKAGAFGGEDALIKAIQFLKKGR